MSEHKIIRPKIVDVGFGPQPARLQFKRSTGIYELPERGARVPWDGVEGNFWRRRVAEGGAEIVEPERKPKPKKTSATTSES